jgi:hypothetical protein
MLTYSHTIDTPTEYLPYAIKGRGRVVTFTHKREHNAFGSAVVAAEEPVPTDHHQAIVLGEGSSVSMEPYRQRVVTIL